jgi:hypothetical protein
VKEEALSEEEKSWTVTHDEKQAYWTLFRRYATRSADNHSSFVDQTQAQRMFAGFGIGQRRTLCVFLLQAPHSIAAAE